MSAARPRRLLAFGLLALVLGWLATILIGGRPVPVYDGIGNPDEPYRYVDPPPGSKPTKPPGVGRYTTTLDHGENAASMQASSLESGPQVLVFVPAHGLAVDGNVAQGGNITLVAAPQAPQGQPAKGRFEGNVYHVSVEPALPVHLTPQADMATIQLRALSAAQPGPVVEYRPNASTPWRQLPTAQVGRDVYESQFVGFGDYVLVRLQKATNNTLTIVLSVLALPVVVFAGLVILRLRRRRSS